MSKGHYSIEALSSAVALRDYHADLSHDTEEHKLLCDILDCLHSTGVAPSDMLPAAYKKYQEYAAFEAYGRPYWQAALDDLHATISQLRARGSAAHMELWDNYNDMLSGVIPMTV